MIVAAIVLENVAYVIGAFAGIVIGGLVVTLRHRRPTSVEANVAEFHRGLQALAPDRGPAPVRRLPAARQEGPEAHVRLVAPRLGVPSAAPGEPVATEVETA
jgi:hypothetical protein